MLRKIWNLFGDNWIAILGGIAIILMARMSPAEELQSTTPAAAIQEAITLHLDSCRQSAHMQEKTDQVSFGGEMLTDGDWSVPYSTITVTFADGTEFVWSPRTVASERKPALMDWIATALAHKEKTGFPPFAARGDEGLIWLVSPFISEGRVDCLAQPLDIPVLH